MTGAASSFFAACFFMRSFVSVFSRPRTFYSVFRALIPGLLALLLSACHQVCVMPEDLYADLNKDYPSKTNIAQINQSVGEKEGVPARVKKMRFVGPASIARLKEAGIVLPEEPKGNLRYVTLVFENNQTAEGVLHEQRLETPGAAILTRWVPAEIIAAHLRERDKRQFSADYGLKWAKPDFNSPKIQICVGRMTAQGYQESFPFEVWSYCADPKTKKSLNKFHNAFFLDLKKIFYDPVYILLDAS